MKSWTGLWPVTVGVAISDPLLLTAQGIEVIHRKQENKLRRTLARIDELIKEYDVAKIVVGYPKHMNNSIEKEQLNQKSLQTSFEKGRIWRLFYGMKG